MKLKKILGVSLLAASLGVAAVASVAFSANNKDAEAVSASAYANKLMLKYQKTSYIGRDNAQLCVYLWNDNGGGTGVKLDGWTNVVDFKQTDNTEFYFLDYDIGCVPANMIVCRMSSTATAGNWDDVWAQSSDYAFNEATALYDGDGSGYVGGWTLTASFRSSTIPSFGEKAKLDTILTDLKYGTDPQVYGEVTLAEDEEFKVIAGDGTWSGYYNTPSELEDCFSGGSHDEAKDDNPNIVCERAGTYEFFLDTESKEIWITSETAKNADGWAQYFNSHVGCDDQGVDLPKGWEDCRAEYLKLTEAEQKFVGDTVADDDPTASNLARAMATYDWAVAHHTELQTAHNNYVITSTGGARSANYYTPNVAGLNMSNEATVALIIVITAISLTSIGTLVFLKKRKHD